MPDQLKFNNQDLVLKVSPNIDPSHLNLDEYEPFIDALCETREYQKEAIRTTLKYFLGRNYNSLRELAKENFNSNEKLHERYTTFKKMASHLQIPDKLTCSIDLATATGKSYVMYGIARIMLAHGAIDRVLVLCPSRTIEKGLLKKFRLLSSDSNLKELLPESSRILNPHIIDGTESIIDGTICIENFHATLRHVKSSIRDSLNQKGNKTLILNDEVHHVYNPVGKDLKKWKEFLLDPDFNFHYIAGFSGTCYLGNDYFSDVIIRYSLREAIEDGYAKVVDYVDEDTSLTQDERFQKIHDNHLQNKQFYRKIKPLTILITHNITTCKKLTHELVQFLSKQEGPSCEDIQKKVLIVTSAREHQPNNLVLENVDSFDNDIEWITSVSMLTEGWDVQNVFQIVPHEERAFNSKLLISQVLGRGLRIPDPYRGERPIVTVFNHDSWSSKIKHLVDEVMEIEKRIGSYPVIKETDYHFDIHQIDYSKTQEKVEFPQTGEYEFSDKPFKLVSQVKAIEKETTYARATTGDRRSKKTLIQYDMYSVDEVTDHILSKLMAIDTEEETSYADKYDFDWIKKLIIKSLREVGEEKDQVSKENRQRLQKAFGVVHRKSSHTVRYKMSPRSVFTINTADRRKNSVGLNSIRHHDCTIFIDDNSFKVSDEDTLNLLNEIIEDEGLPRSAWQKINNVFHFKVPLNLVITDHKPEREFVRGLVKTENLSCLNSWIKSTDQEFYSIEYSWRKGEHTKRRFFNPDFFIKQDNHIYHVLNKELKI